jgi:cell division septal protein FtsQ
VIFFRRKKAKKIRTLKKNPQRPQSRERFQKPKKIPGALRRKFGKMFSKIGVLLSLGGILVGILFTVFFFAFFTIQDIKISRQDIRTNGEALAKTIGKKYFGKNIFLVQKSQISGTITALFPEVSDVVIQKKYPHTLHITVSTYPVAFRWSCERSVKKMTEEGDLIEKNVSELYYLNSKGVVTTPEKEEKKAFLIYEKLPCPKKIEKADYILSPDVIKKISLAKKELEELIDVPIVRSGYFRDAKEIHLIAENETSFWIDFISPIHKQIEKFQAAVLLEPKLKNAMHHIDLRVNGKIFYAPL